MSGDTSPASGSTSGQLRTLAVRITDDLRAQLDVLAQLNGRSTTEEIRLALEQWITQSKTDPSLLKKAEAVRAEIERDAQTRRNAIAAIFEGGNGGESGAPTSTTRSAGRAKNSQ